MNHFALSWPQSQVWPRWCPTGRICGVPLWGGLMCGRARVRHGTWGGSSRAGRARVGRGTTRRGRSMARVGRTLLSVQVLTLTLTLILILILSLILIPIPILIFRSMWRGRPRPRLLTRPRAHAPKTDTHAQSRRIIEPRRDFSPSEAYSRISMTMNSFKTGSFGLIFLALALSALSPRTG